MRDHSVANRQMIEIAKAVSYESDILIMDEPTSALTDREVDHLFRIIADLKAQGKGIVYITHKMNELFTIADDVSIFRDGRYIATHPAKDLTRDQVIQHDGRPRDHPDVPEGGGRDRRGGAVASRTSASRACSATSRSTSAGARSWASRASSAPGRTNVAETIFGVTPATGGEIRLNGKPIRIGSPRDGMQAGMALLTEDRKDTGCFLMPQRAREHADGGADRPLRRGPASSSRARSTPNATR